jgi:hypothetical protein
MKVELTWMNSNHWLKDGGKGPQNRWNSISKELRQEERRIGSITGAGRGGMEKHVGLRPKGGSDREPWEASSSETIWTSFHLIWCLWVLWF